MTTNESVQNIPVEVTMREIKELLRTFEEAGWANLDVTLGDFHLVLGRDGAPAGSAAPIDAPTVVPSAPDAVPSAAAITPQPTAGELPAPAPATVASGAAAPRSATAVEVRAPVVGTFWISPAPGQPPFVEVGQTVDKGQQLGIVEVMKLMSHVSSPIAGTVVEILAANASMVEFDQALVLIEPSDG